MNGSGDPFYVCNPHQRRKGVRTLFWGVELGEDAGTGRPKRADEAGGIYHALNRGNARATIFHEPEVCRYVERNALRAGLVRQAEDWRWGSLSRCRDEPEREPRLLSVWPIARSPRWTERVNRPLTAAELKMEGLPLFWRETLGVERAGRAW